MGARPLRRIVESEIETKIADMIISNEIKENDSIEVDTDDDLIVVRKTVLEVEK